MVYSQAERVFILENYFASKSFAPVREAFSNVYPGKGIPNKTTVHRLVTKFWDTVSVCVSSRMCCTSAVKLFCKFCLTNESENKLFCLVIFVAPKLTSRLLLQLRLRFKRNILYRVLQAVSRA
jgi:hypothetical protein